MLRAVTNTVTIVDEGNVAAACVEAGATVASALVIAAAASGYDPRDDFGEGLQAALLYWVLGQVVICAYVLLLDLITRVPLPRALAMLSPASQRDAGGGTHRNVLSGVALTSATAISATSDEAPSPPPSPPAGVKAHPSSFSALNQAAEHNVATGMALGLELVTVGLLLQAPIYAGWSLLAWIIWLAVTLLGVMPLLHVFFDLVVLHGTSLAENVNVERNWGAAVLVGSLKVAAALVLMAIYKRNCKTSSYQGGEPGTCEVDAQTDTNVEAFRSDARLRELLSTAAVPDVFSGRAAIDLAVFAALVSACKGVFWLRLVLRDGLGAAGRHAASFSISKTLADPHNNAVALSFASYALGSTLVMVGVLDCPDTDAGWLVGNLVGWTAIGAGLMLLSQKINDVVLMRGVQNTACLLDDNVGVACLEAGSHLACGLIIRACVSGGASSFWEGLLLTLVFWALTQLLFVLATLGFRAATAFDDHAELTKGNAAVGLSGGLALVALAWLMSKVILYSGALLLFLPAVAGGVAVLGLLRLLVDRVLLPGAKLDTELLHGNWGAALVEGCSAVALAMMTALLLPQDPMIGTCMSWDDAKLVLHSHVAFS